MWKNNVNLIVWIWWKVNIEYIKKLLWLWVREFFVWFVPTYWSEKFSYEISPNRRYSSDFQVHNFKDFLLLTKILKKYDSKVYFTLNDHNYSNKNFKYIKKIIEDTKDYIDWYIIANYALLWYLKNMDKEIHISWDNCVLNNYTIDFMVANGISRVILPRNITLEEIEEIALYRNKNYKKLELELFVNDPLLYNCWLCTSFHWEENYIFCLDKKANIRTLISYDSEIKDIWINIDVNKETEDKNCSLCFLNKFVDLWINSYKIPWRTWKLDKVIKRVAKIKLYLKNNKFSKDIILKEFDNCKKNECMYEI